MRKRFKELCDEVTKNREELKEQRELIDFLLEHDRKDIIFNIQTDPLYNGIGYCLEAKYIYTNKISVVKITGNILLENDGDYTIAVQNKAEVIENDDEKFVVKVSNKYNLFKSIYYKVFKQNGKVADVTEYYPNEESTTVANQYTPTETDFKYFTAEQVKKMSQKEFKENFADIMKSMKKW